MWTISSLVVESVMIRNCTTSCLYLLCFCVVVEYMKSCIFSVHHFLAVNWPITAEAMWLLEYAFARTYDFMHVQPPVLCKAKTFSLLLIGRIS